MATDTIELLKECSSGCKMAINSIRQVREYAKDNRLTTLLNDYADRHSKLQQETAALLGEYHKVDEEPSTMARICSWMDIEMKMLMEADSHQIAKLMMDGCNMGIQSVCEYINKYEAASDESVKIAHKLVKTEEKFMEEMQAFV